MQYVNGANKKVLLLTSERWIQYSTLICPRFLFTMRGNCTILYGLPNCNWILHLPLWWAKQQLTILPNRLSHDLGDLLSHQPILLVKREEITFCVCPLIFSQILIFFVKGSKTKLFKVTVKVIILSTSKNELRNWI